MYVPTCHSHVPVLYLVVPAESLAEADIKVLEVICTRHLPSAISPRLAVRVDEGGAWVLSQQRVKRLREPGQVIVGNVLLIQLEKFLCLCEVPVGKGCSVSPKHGKGFQVKWFHTKSAVGKGSSR